MTFPEQLDLVLKVLLVILLTSHTARVVGGGVSGWWRGRQEHAEQLRGSPGGASRERAGEVTE